MKNLFLAIAIVFLSASFVQAADPSLEIEFTYPTEAIPTTTEFRLYVEKDVGVKTHLATLSDPTATIWQVELTDIPMGKRLNYYMSAVDVDNEEGMSPAYPFKLIGKPTIIRINKY